MEVDPAVADVESSWQRWTTASLAEVDHRTMADDALVKRSKRMGSMYEQQTAFFTSMEMQQKAFITSMEMQQKAFITSMEMQQKAFITFMEKQQASMDKRQADSLTSINQHLAKLIASNNLQTKVEDEDHTEKGKGEQKIDKEEEGVVCGRQLHESPAPWPASSSRTEEKKYRLHIVGEVCHRATKDKMHVIKGRPIPHIEVLLKHGDEPISADHRLASVRVKLVVLDVKTCFQELTDWPPEEFEDNFMTVSKNNSGRTRMSLKNDEFNLVGGRKVYTVASINESSCKQKVRLGVMAVGDGSVQGGRVLEGVSSNEFYVIHEPRGDSAAKHNKRQKTGLLELNTNGKRVINIADTTLQPSTSYLHLSGHVQSPQKFGQHATGEQPSHARNACPTQNWLTTQIGDIGGAVPPEDFAPNTNAASVQIKLVDNQGFPSYCDEAYNKVMEEFFGNQGHPLGVLHPDMLVLGRAIGDTRLPSSAEDMGFRGNHLFDGHLSLATQTQQTSTQLTRQPGGGQGQPGTLQSNNLHTNSQGHTTTAAATHDVTNAQMHIHSTMDVEMGGHEQGDGGRVRNDAYGGGNDGRAGDENLGGIFTELCPGHSPVQNYRYL